MAEEIADIITNLLFAYGREYLLRDYSTINSDSGRLGT